MKQALQLYAHIKKDQMLLAFILGLGLMGLQVGSFLWQHQLSAIAESGILLTGGWLIVAFLSLLLDQSRRLDVWLYTQRVSRGELFLSRVLLLVVLPIVVGFLVTIGMLFVIQPVNMIGLMTTSLNFALGYFFFASIAAIIYTVIGPNWMKVVGLLFTVAVMGQPLSTIETYWQKNMLLDLTIRLLASLVLFGIGYLLAKKISGETTEEAVRIRYLRWPIVIFVFAATELTTLMSHVGAIDVKVVISTMIIPIILAGITFAFVFKPRFKMTWDR